MRVSHPEFVGDDSHHFFGRINRAYLRKRRTTWSARPLVESGPCGLECFTGGAICREKNQA